MRPWSSEASDTAVAADPPRGMARARGAPTLADWRDMHAAADARIVSCYGGGEPTARLRAFAANLLRQADVEAAPEPGRRVNRAFFPGLTARRWWDPADAVGHAAAAALERAHGAVVAESAALEAGSGCYARDVGWDGAYTVSLIASGAAQRAWDALPETAAALSEAGLADCPRSAMLARQAPGTGLRRHSDYLNFVLTLHLGVRGCGEAWMEVAGETRRWRDGRLDAFDSTWEHETYNPGAAPRDLLLVDVWHPDLTPVEVDGVAFLYAFRDGWLARKAAGPLDVRRRLRPLSKPGRARQLMTRTAGGRR